MLKFKILFIPLLLGIFSGVSATCKLTLTTENLNKHCVIGNDCGASDNGYYLVDNTLLKYTYSENKQSCDTFEIPLPGYYINQKATGNEDKYIQCNSFKSCSFVPAPTEIESCTDENEGQLILVIKNNVQLCTKINYFNKYEGHIELINTGMDLLNYKYSENKRYVIRHSMNNEVFNFDISTTASTYYIVKKDEKSIVFDPKFNNENSGTIVKNACADTSGLILERIYDYCNHKSSGMYYSCLNGKCYARYKTYLEIERPWEYHGCVEVYDDYCSINSEPGKCSSKDNGYYYYQDEEEGTMSIFKFTYDENEPTCEKQYDIFNTRGYYWNGHNYKNVFKCNGQSCQPENVEFNPELDCDGYDNQIIDTGFNLVFCGYNNDNFPKPLYIDEEDFYFIQGRETSGNLFNDPKIFYAIKNSGQSLIIDETINGSTDLDTTLFCTKGECTRQYNNGYYLSNEHSSKLTKCDNNGCAEEKQNANMGYYLNGAALTNEESLTLIKCDKNGCGYANSVPGYYLNAAYVNGVETKNLIKCTSERCRNYIANNNGYYLSSEYSSKLIKCDDNGCSIEGQKANKGYYMNAEAIKDKELLTLIKCDDSGCDYADSVPGYYLNAAYVNGVETKNLIKCTSEKCINITINNNGYYLSSEYSSKLIKCDDSGCTIGNKDANKGYYLNTEALTDEEKLTLIKCDDNGCGYANSVPGYYMNAAYVNGVETKNLIKCTSEKCINITINNNGYYLSNEYSSKLIKCDDNGCIIGDKDANKGYYLNAEESLTLIKCDKNGCSNTNSIPGYYLNAAYVNGVETKNLIKCTLEKCINVTVNNNGYYLSSENSSKLIQCDNSGCALEEQKANKGYYLNAETINSLILIKCDDRSCSYANSVPGYYMNAAYVNGVETKNLIKCTSEKCDRFEVEGNDNIYINNGVTDFEVDALIVCKSNQCISAPGEIDYAFKITINGNGLKTCEITKGAKFDDGYYLINEIQDDNSINSIINNTNIRSTNLILLTTEGKNQSCKVISSLESKYFVNANSSKLEKGLIICSNSDCQLVDATAGYYLNGAENVSQLTNALIECNKKKCSVRNGENELNINNNGITNFGVDALIKCNNNQCTLAPGELDNTFKIITVNELKTCEIAKGATCSDGYYLINDQQDEISINSIVKETDVSSSNLILVTTEGSDKSCKVISSFKNKYFVNAYANENDSKLEKSLISFQLQIVN